MSHAAGSACCRGTGRCCAGRHGCSRRCSCCRGFAGAFPRHASPSSARRYSPRWPPRVWAARAIRGTRLPPALQELAAGALALAPALLALREGDLAAYHGAEHVSIGTYEHGERAREGARALRLASRRTLAGRYRRRRDARRTRARAPPPAGELRRRARRDGAPRRRSSAGWCEIPSTPSRRRLPGRARSSRSASPPPSRRRSRSRSPTRRSTPASSSSAPHRALRLSPALPMRWSWARFSTMSAGCS